MGIIRVKDMATSQHTHGRNLRIALSRAGCLLAYVLLGTVCARAQTLGWPDGVNIQAGYFNSADKGNIPIGWELMRRFDKIGTVRIELPPEQKVRIETMQRWIQEANQNGYNVIATYHRYEHNGSPDPEALLAAARWWKAHYAELSKAGPFTVNLMNEWGDHDITPEQYASAYNKAIAIVREVYKGPLIIDIPGWGQETYTAAEASAQIEDRDIVFSVHIYSSAYVKHGPRRWMKPLDLELFAKVDRPIIVGEFGGMREGGADWAALTDKARELGWTVIAWAWNGDGEGMNMVCPSWNDQHSPSAYYPSTYFPSVYARIGRDEATHMNLSVHGDIVMGPDASAYTFAIHGNASWRVECEGADWLRGLAPLSGWGTGQVNFEVAANDGPVSRMATIWVRGGGVERSFRVVQHCLAEAR